MTAPKSKPKPKASRKPRPKSLPAVPAVPAVPSTTKPNWVNRILYAAVVGYVIWMATHRKSAQPPTPQPVPAPTSDLTAEVAPLFPADQNEAASLYAAYFTAQADKATKDGKSVPQAVFKKARESMGLADNPQLAVIVNREFKPFTLLKGDWPPDQVEAYVQTQRDLAAACLAASAD